MFGKMEPFQTQESTGFPILLLSNELLLHIVKELKASDLLSISASCKRFLGVCHMIRYGRHCANYTLACLKFSVLILF